MSSTGFRGIPPRKKREPAVNISRTTIAATTTNKVSVENTSKSVVNPESLSGIKSISQPVKIVPHQQVRQQSEGIVAGVAKIAITTTEQPQITARNPTIRSGAENKVDNIIVPSNSSPGSEFTGTGVSGPISISSNTKNPSPAGKSPDQKSSKLVESSPGATDYLGASGAAYNHTVPEKIPGRNLEALAKQRIPSPTGDQRKGSPLPVDTETSPRIISGLPLVGNALSTAEVPTSPSRQSLLHKSPHFSPSNLPHSLQSASAGSHRMATSPNVGEDSAIVNTLPKSPSGRLLTPMQIIPEASANNAYTRLPVKYEEPLSLSTLGNDRSGRNLLSGTISSTSVKDEYSPDPSIQASSTVRDTGGKSNSTTAPPSGKSPLMNQTEPVQKASANEYHNSNEIPRYEGVETQEATSNGGEQLPHDQSQSNEFQFENQFNEGEVNLEAPSEVLHFNYQESFQFKNPNAGDQYYQSEMKDIYEYNDDGVLDQQHNYLRKRHEQHQENGGLEHPLEFQEYQNYGPQSNANEQNFNQQLGFENNTDIYTQNSNPQMYEAHDSTRLQSNFDNEQISYGEDNYENYGGQYYENENGGLQYENENGGLQYENDYDGQQYEDDYGGQHYQNGDGGPQYANEYNFQQLGIEYHSQQYENEYEGQLYASTYDNQQYGNAYDGQQYEHEYNVQQYNDQQRSDHQIDADYQSELYPSEYLDQENYTHQLRFHGSAFETQGGYNQHQEYREYTELGQQHLNSEAQAEYYPAGAENIGQEQDYEGLTSVDHGDLNQNDFSTYQLHRDQSKSQTLINGPQLLEMKICYPCNLEYEKHMNFCGACGSRLEVPTPIAQNIHQQTKSNTSPVTAMHFHDAQLHQNTIPTIPGAFQRFNCIATFGFNGQLVYTTPIIQTIFQTTNAGVPKPVLKAFPGPIKICKVEKLLDSKILQELNQILKFGPLFSDLRPSQARIIEILENLKVHSESKDFSNLIEYLIILTKNTPEDLALRSLRDLLAEDSQTDQSTAGILQTHLMKGNLGAACSAAASSGFWLEAMLISKHINSQAMGAVTRDYIQKAMSGAVVSPSLQDYPALAIALAALGGAEPESTIQNCIIDSSSNWNWKSILMILISIKDKIDPQFFNCLACLMSEKVSSSVGSLCVLASFGCHHTVFDLQNSKRIYINGNEARFPATFYKDILSIRITEIFEVLLSLKTWPNTTVLHFPAYKIWLAGYLCDIGLGHQAAQYCESIATSVKSTQKNTPFMHQRFLYTLKELEDRLRVSSSDNGSEKKKAESSSWFGQLKTNFTGQALGKGLETFMAAAVGVDDSSVQSMESRTSSLYPVPGSDRFEGSNTPISGHIPHMNTMSPITPGTSHAPPLTHQPYPNAGVKQNQEKYPAHLPRISETTASDFSSSQFTSNRPMNTQAPFPPFPNTADFSTLKSGNYGGNSPGFIQNHNSNALNPVPDLTSVSNPMDDLGFGNNSLTVKPAQKSGTSGSEAAQTIEKKPEPVSSAPAEEESKKKGWLSSWFGGSKKKDKEEKKVHTAILPPSEDPYAKIKRLRAEAGVSESSSAVVPPPVTPFTTPLSTPGPTPSTSASPSRVTSPAPSWSADNLQPNTGRKKNARSRYVDVMANPNQPPPVINAPTAFMPTFQQPISLNNIVPVQTNPSPSENLNQTRKNSSTLNGSFGMLSPSNTSGSIQNSRSYTGSPGLSNAQPGLQPSMQKNVQPHYGGNSPEGRIGQAQNPHDTNQVQSNFNMMKPPQHNAQFGGNIPYPTNSLRSPSPNSSIMSHEYNAPQKIPQRDSRTAQTTPNPTGMQRSSMHRSKQNLSRYPSSNSIRSPAKGNPAPSDM